MREKFRFRRRPRRRDADGGGQLYKVFPILVHFNAANLITTMGFVFGVFACFFMTQLDLRMVVIFLFLAGVMDLVDGYVAAKLGQQTEFGKHVDTLVDFFTCMVIPVWMVFHIEGWGLAPHIFPPMLFYCICGLWRLANYNVSGASKTFRGLPVPGAMFLVVVSIWCVNMYGLPVAVTSATFACTALLMVSGIKLPKYGPWQIAMGFAGLGFLVAVLLHP